MHTPTHALVSMALLGKRGATDRTLAILAGA
jgi:hypothetical protein